MQRAQEAGLDLAELTRLAVSSAREAAVLVADRSHMQREHIQTKSSGTDMVTEVDRAAEHLLVERLRGAQPRDGILGEEGASHPSDTGICWVLDPLDGTTNYLYRGWHYAVSVAAEFFGEPVAAAVIDAATMETFSATAGSGAWFNGHRIEFVTARPLAASLVGTGFSYDADRRHRQGEVLCKVLPKVRDIRSSGVASLDLCYVALGRLDAYFEDWLQHWDWAGGALIASEAGVSVGNIAGGPPDASVLAAREPLAGQLRALLLAVS